DEIAARDFGAARPAQRPSQAAVVSETVEVKLARIGQGESIGILLAGLGDRAIDRAAQRQRRRRVRALLGIENEIDRTGIEDIALDQQRVGPGRCQRLRGDITETVEPSLLSIGISQAPEDVATGLALRVEIEQIAGVGVELIKLACITRIERVGYDC